MEMAVSPANILIFGFSMVCLLLGHDKKTEK